MDNNDEQEIISSLFKRSTVCVPPLARNYCHKKNVQHIWIVFTLRPNNSCEVTHKRNYYHPFRKWSRKRDVFYCFTTPRKIKKKLGEPLGQPSFIYKQRFSGKSFPTEDNGVREKIFRGGSPGSLCARARVRACVRVFFIRSSWMKFSRFQFRTWRRRIDENPIKNSARPREFSFRRNKCSILNRELHWNDSSSNFFD